MFAVVKSLADMQEILDHAEDDLDFSRDSEDAEDFSAEELIVYKEKGIQRNDSQDDIIDLTRRFSQPISSSS